MRGYLSICIVFFFSSRRRHTRFDCDWSSDVCSSDLLPELRVRYPDLGLATEEELTAKVRLFEAVARLFARLAQGGPLVLFVDDLHWVDGASLDLVRYLARSWKEQSLRIVLLATVGSERLKLHAALAAGLADLGRELPVRQVVLQALSRR